MVSQNTKIAIAVTGLVSYISWIGVDKYFQHKSDEIRQNVPGVQRSEKIPLELSALVDEIKERTKNEDYRIDDIAEKYNAIATEYQTLTSQQTIKDAREQIRAISPHPAAILFFFLGTICLGYTMFNARNSKENSEPPRPAEAVTPSDADC
ncbi:hypothetical protein HY485_04660 [Candidatus Woesearchaeota archaeon]|nr:hypothetical protein [Candidatus Woesearchaeota archaeon]